MRYMIALTTMLLPQLVAAPTWPNYDDLPGCVRSGARRAPNELDDKCCKRQMKQSKDACKRAPSRKRVNRIQSHHVGEVVPEGD